MKAGYSISTEKSKLDIEKIHAFLSQSYWAKGRRLDQVRQSIANSLCFGLYKDDDELVGFARVVTDNTVFAYLMDVFIMEQYRGIGLGNMLIEHVINYPPLQEASWMLATSDAHGFYRRFGFHALKSPEKYMRRSAAEKA